MRRDDNSRIAFAHAFRHGAHALKRRVLQRLRVAGAIEGISFIVLLIAAILFKRILGHEEAIFIPGLVHGILFLLYCAMLTYAKKVHERPVKWAAKYFIAALVPFGPFVVDKSLKLEMDELPAEGLIERG